MLTFTFIIYLLSYMFLLPALILIFSYLYFTILVLTTTTTTYIQFLRVCFVFQIYFILGFGPCWIYALLCPWWIDYNIYFGLSALVGLVEYIWFNYWIGLRI